MALNKKQRKFVDNLLQGDSARGSALRAGYNPGYAQQLMKLPNIKAALLQKLEKVGITEDYMAQKMRDGLEAQTVPQKEGGARYDDQFIRHKWMELLLKIRGDFAPEKIESSHKTVTIVIDSGMIRALADSGAISPVEMGLLEHEPIIDPNAEVIDALPIGEEK